MPPLINSGGLNGNKSNGVSDFSEVFLNFYLLSLPLRRVYCIAKHIAELLEFFYCGISQIILLSMGILSEEAIM